MSDSCTPKQVVIALMQGISDGTWTELHMLFSHDAVIDYPFALPARTQLKGLEAIKEYFAATSTYPLKLQVKNMVVHQTQDPEVVVAEWEYNGLQTATGRAFQVSNITVTTVRNGTIVASRDYHNHAALASVLGRLPSLLGALAKSDRSR